MVSVSQTGGSLLDKIVDFIIPPYIVAFLNNQIYRAPFLILNYWSFVHFFAGVLFFFLQPNRFKLWIIINLSFEIIEFVLGLGGNPLFVEEFVDIFWDVLLSLSGFLIAQMIAKKLKK
ncbi:MAG: hypothetical protein KKA79_00765 [Nanoarchaeota archaeon]|nr:hypothetical protein [Nanoarchaeota archaeon]MCG2719000.1 hypothetical protein [Nanoarchaeota archaeon]